MGTTPFSSLLGGILALIFGTLTRYRLLWFLREDTMLSSGRPASTAEFAATISQYFYIFGAFAIVLSFVLLFCISEEHRQRLAQLPRWQRFLFWPIERHIAPRTRAQSILTDLRKLKSRGAVGMFGEAAHEYKLNRRLSNIELTKFETEHHFVLPADYREFLLEVGNGGAGPFYGLFPLGQHMQMRNIGPWNEMVGDPALPFPHTGPWNDLSKQPTEADEEDLDRYDKLAEEFEQHYFDRHWVHGAVPIADRGCALGVLLVTTGPEAGNVWHDDRADHNGIYPVQREGAGRVTFIEWYRQWLDEALSKLGTS